jgi:hypothetical protein
MSCAPGEPVEERVDIGERRTAELAQVVEASQASIRLTGMAPGTDFQFQNNGGRTIRLIASSIRERCRFHLAATTDLITVVRNP